MCPNVQAELSQECSGVVEMSPEEPHKSGVRMSTPLLNSVKKSALLIALFLQDNTKFAHCHLFYHLTKKVHQKFAF